MGSPCGTIMLSPSTAPRWKRQTRTGRSTAVEGGGRGSRPSAARAKKSGSSPMLNRAMPPDFTNTRLDIDMCPSSTVTAFLRPSPPSTALLLLKLRSANREADCEGTRLGRIGDVRQLTSEDLLGVFGHRSTENLLVDHADQLFGVSHSDDGVEDDRHALQLARRERDGGVHPIEQCTAVHPRRFPLGIPIGSDVEIKWLAEARHHLCQAGRGVRLGVYCPCRADHELEGRLHLGTYVLRRPEIGAVKDGPQHLAYVTARALPRGHGVVHAAVGRVVVHETFAQLAAHVVHRGRVVGQELEEPDPFVHVVAPLKPDTQHLFFPGVMRPVVELEVSPLLGALDAPAGENARDVDHVLLRVAAVYAEGVELEQLPGIVFVDPFRHALEGAAAHRVLSGRVAHRAEQVRSTAGERPGADAGRLPRCSIGLAASLSAIVSGAAASLRSRRSRSAAVYMAARSPRSYPRIWNCRSRSARRWSSIPWGESWRSIHRITPSAATRGTSPGLGP